MKSKKINKKIKMNIFRKTIVNQINKKCIQGPLEV